MRNDTNQPFAGLLSALALMVVLVALGVVALLVGVGTGSTLSGWLAFVALMLVAGVAIVRSPISRP